MILIRYKDNEYYIANQYQILMLVAMYSFLDMKHLV